jgi:peroxiredoxin
MRLIVRAVVGAVAVPPLWGCHSSDSSPRLHAGTVFPAFSLPAADGQMHGSGDYAGSPLLINFWATWCPPCRAEMPDLQALHLRFAARGLRVLGVSVDDDANLVREFLLKQPVDFPVLLDSRRALAEGVLRLNSYPVSCLVGRDGVVVEVIYGARPWADAEQAEMIARRLSIA